MAQPPSLNRLIQQPGKVPSSGKWRIETLELPGTPEGMRPTALAVVPASFTSDLVSLDDVLVCLGGSEGNSRPKIARYRQVEVDEDARALPLPLVVPVVEEAKPGTLISLLSFGPRGESLYLSFDESGEAFELDAALHVKRRIAFGVLQRERSLALAIHPSTGRVWAADTSRDEIRSVDPETGEWCIEIALYRENVRSHAGRAALISRGALSFSPDGKRFALRDSYGWVWVGE
jgi:hypothetical protein